MVTLDTIDLGKKFATELFSEATLHAQTGQKIGLIGDNGSGKSTFLKILAGIEEASEGRMVWSKNSTVGYLEQEPGEDTLSGGEKKILKLAQLFYGNYDCLLLDEPDNHLDLKHKEWFEELVKEYSGLAIVISHDRHFLENGVNKIWHLENCRIKEYWGSYKEFKYIYEEEKESQEHLWQVQEKERLRLADVVREFRISAASNSKLAGRYRGMVKRYEKWVAEMVEKPKEEKILKLTNKIDKQHKRKTAVHITQLSKRFGDKKVLDKLNLHIFCGEKIAIVAPNGSGKSTLLNILAGKLKQDEGEFRIGPGLKVGYYAQEHLAVLDEHADLISEIQKEGNFEYYEGIAYLKGFKFSEAQIKSEVRFLSGGQKSRLQLAKFLATNPEVLVLDEPTNHLDLKTVLALEKFLLDYKGTLILVSHDKNLVDKVAEKKYLLNSLL
jgi:ATP-binding cassette subfamily F protein 3